MSGRVKLVAVLALWWWVAASSTLPGPVDVLEDLADGDGIELAAGPGAIDGGGGASTYTGPTSGRLTPAEIAEAAHSAGFRGDSLVTAVAVALAESAGQSCAQGDQHLAGNGWGNSVGLWQIRSRAEDHGSGRPRDASRLCSPAFNAGAAWSISDGGRDWSPWSTWPGKQRDHLARARAGVAEAGL